MRYSKSKIKTFEEFKVLALNPPKYGGNSIFSVEKYFVLNLDDTHKSYYPEFHLGNRVVGYCSSLENAEKLIRDIVGKHQKAHLDLYCFYIKEFPVDKKSDCRGDYGLSMRLYDGSGKFVDRSYCSGLVSDIGNMYGEFRGRSEENIRFHPGDIVEVRIDDEVFLGIMCSAIYSIERCWNIITDDKRKNFYLPIKDSVTVLIKQSCKRPEADGNGWRECDYFEMTAPALSVMSPHYPVSQKLQDQYKAFYRDYIEEQDKLEKELMRERIEAARKENSIIKECQKLQERKFELNAHEALCLLAECYVSYCGVSLSIRTVAYDAAEYWMKELIKINHPLADKAKEESFNYLIPYLSQEFEQAIKILEEYDVAPLDKEEAIDAMCELLQTADDKLKIALAAGFLDVMQYYD